MYDVRLGQDAINSRNHADIMTLSRHDDDHPFKYARVIGIFHVDVIHGVEGATQHPVSKEVLWVRRFRRDESYRAGFKQNVCIALNSFLLRTIPLLGFWTQMKSSALATLFLVFVMGSQINFSVENHLDVHQMN